MNLDRLDSRQEFDCTSSNLSSFSSAKKLISREHQLPSNSNATLSGGSVIIDKLGRIGSTKKLWKLTGVPYIWRNYLGRFGNFECKHRLIVILRFASRKLINFVKNAFHHDLKRELFLPSTKFG